MKQLAYLSTTVLALAGLLLVGFTLLDRAAPPDGFGGNVVTQVGIVVHDVDAAAAAYADLLGVEVPDVIVTDPLAQAHTEYHGKPTEARARLAFFRLENLQLELIEPVGGPSTWAEALAEKGQHVHHIAFRVEGMDEHVALLERRGAALVQRGDFTGGSYAYVDATEELGAVLELLTSDG